MLQAAADAGVSRVVHTSSVGALGIPGDGTPGTETTPVTLADMVGPYKASKFLAEQVAARLRAQGASRRDREPLDADRSVGRQADADRPDDRRLPQGKMFATLDTGLNLVHVRDVARGHLLAAERAARSARRTSSATADLTLAEIWRAARGDHWRPAAAHARSPTRWPGSPPGAWRSPPASPAARRACVADRGAHGPQAHVLQPGQGRAATSACRRPTCAKRSATRPTGSSSTATPGSRGRSRDRTPGRPADPEEPLELLLRLPHASARIARTPCTPSTRSAGRWTTSPTSATSAASTAAAQRSQLERWRRDVALCYEPGGRPSIRSRRRLARAVSAFAIPRAALLAIIDGVEMDLDQVRYETADGSLSLLLPGRLGGRSLLHRDLRLHRSARPRVRGEPRHGAPADEHHPRRRRRRAARAACTCRRKTCESSA